jgi:AcrR family transcriptional regulator
MVVAARLGREDWIGEGVRTLATVGAVGLKPEKLAAALGVSRGSFYWHFADVDDFHEAVLNAAEQRIVDQPLADAERRLGEGNQTTLSALFEQAFTATQTLDRAIFSWALSSPLAAEAASRIGQRRVELLTQQFSKLGFPLLEAKTRALALYWTHLGRCMSPEHKLDAGALPILTALFLQGSAAP